MLRGLVTLLASVTITFVVLRVMPGDPTLLVTDMRMTPELRQQLLRDYGLDRPILEQFVLYLVQLARGNLGVSFRQLEPVTDVVLRRLPWTLLLTGSAFVVTVLVGIPLGVSAAVRRGGTLDRAINAFSIIGYSIFVPWLGLSLLYLLGFVWPVFPIGGAQEIGLTGWPRVWSILHHLVLPVTTLVVINLAGYVLFLRTSMVETLEHDYIRTARSKGLPQRAVVYKHALRNAFLPTLTMMGLQLGYLAGGAVLTETVFAYPGVGRLIYEAVLQLDYPVLQGAFLLIAFFVIAANMLTDMLYGVLDPRVRYE